MISRGSPPFSIADHVHSVRWTSSSSSQTIITADNTVYGIPFDVMRGAMTGRTGTVAVGGKTAPTVTVGANEVFQFDINVLVYALSSSGNMTLMVDLVNSTTGTAYVMCRLGYIATTNTAGFSMVGTLKTTEPGVYYPQMWSLNKFTNIGMYGDAGNYQKSWFSATLIGKLS